MKQRRALMLVLGFTVTVALDGLYGPRSVVNVLIGYATGQPQAKRRPDIPFVPTPPTVVDRMLLLARVTSDDVVYDLGSGDGRIVIAAARTFGARGVGIDLDPNMVAEATRNAARQGVGDRVEFVEGDIFDADISEATVVTLFLLTSMNDKLRPKLAVELQPGTRIVSHAFGMGEWTPERQIVVADRRLFLWRVPKR